MSASAPRCESHGSCEQLATGHLASQPETQSDGALPYAESRPEQSIRGLPPCRPIRSAGRLARSTRSSESSGSSAPFRCLHLPCAHDSGGVCLFPLGAPRCLAARSEATSSGCLEPPMSTTIVFPFQPETMTPAQLAAESFLARYAGHTHELYANNCGAGSSGANATASTRWLAFSVRTSSSPSVISASGVSWRRRSTRWCTGFARTRPAPKDLIDSISSGSYKSRKPSASTTEPLPAAPHQRLARL
jgi:hypothetical protein